MVGKNPVLIWNVFIIQFLELLAPSVETTLNCSLISLELFYHFCVIYKHAHKSLSQMYKKNYLWLPTEFLLKTSSLCIFFLHFSVCPPFMQLFRIAAPMQISSIEISS